MSQAIPVASEVIPSLTSVIVRRRRVRADSERAARDVVPRLGHGSLHVVAQDLSPRNVSQCPYHAKAKARDTGVAGKEMTVEGSISTARGDQKSKQVFTTTD